VRFFKIEALVVNPDDLVRVLGAHREHALFEVFERYGQRLKAESVLLECRHFSW